jgi:tetratricopeptide (TPR) repeat protein
MFSWLLAVAVAQTPGIQDGVAAQLDFQRGTLLREDGRAEEAAAAFRSAAEHLERDSLPPSAALAYRAGNAWFLGGDLPHAIAAYHRGLSLDPADARLRSALDDAREQVQYPPSPELARLLRPERDWWPPWLSVQVLGGYACGVYVVGCSALTRWRMTRRQAWLMIALVFFALAAIPAFGSGVRWRDARRDAVEPIVVAARDEPLRAGNGVEYQPIFDLPRGAEMRRSFERSGWLQVETGGGLVGWVPIDSVVPVREPAAPLQ